MYSLSEAAADDIEGILSYTLIEFGDVQATKYYQGLVNCFKNLENNPKLGTVAVEIRENYLRFPHESHVIFYQQEETGIFIVRVLHSKMDPVSHF